MSKSDFTRHRREVQRALQANKYEVGDAGFFIPAMSAWAGTHLTIEHRRGGDLMERSTGPNILPLASRNDIVDVICHGVAAVSTWYGALFSGHVTPGDGPTAATFPAVCTEFVGYDELTRPAWAEAAAVNGATDNAASRALYTVNATAAIYGGGLFSSATKGSTNVADRMLGVARAPLMKNVAAADELLTKFDFTLTSA